MTKLDHAIKELLINKIIDANVNTGHIYSYRAANGVLTDKRRKLNGNIKRGYKRYLMYINKKERKDLSGHRIIWLKKYSLIPDGMAVCHINNIKSDNRLRNLYITSHIQNSKDAAKDGLYKKGINNPASKINSKIVKKIRKEYRNNKISFTNLGKKYGICKSEIGNIINNKMWKII